MSIHKLSFAIVLSSSAMLCSQLVAQSGTTTEVPSAAPATPAAGVPDSTTTQPQTTQPQTTQPQTTQPQTAQPQTAQPQTAQPQTAQPETAQPERPQIPDGADLKAKAAMVMGYNLARNYKTQNPDADYNQVLEGMKDAEGANAQESFVFGHSMMSRMKKQGVGITAAQLEIGVNKAKAGEDLGMSDQEVQMLMMAFGRMVEAERIAERQKTIDNNKAAGEAYIAAQKAANPNLKELGEGVYYEVLTEGTGPKPGENATVSVDYTGTFVDGEVFDSSVKPLDGGPGEPAEFRVGGVIPGFTDSLLAMPVGSKWRVIIPGEKAYGARGSGGKIGPMQTLIFELELLSIVDAGEPAKGAGKAPAMQMTPEMRAQIEAQMKAAIEAQKDKMTPEMKAKVEAEMKSALDSAKEAGGKAIEGAKEAGGKE